jgi:preprotein translocase subunit SecY
MARQLRDSGSFIPGLRPGPRTAEYLETVVERVTYVGAGFLAVIAIIPAIVARQMEIPFLVASFLGGTGLLIVVAVTLDLVQRIEANLLMRNYSGFLASGEQGRPAPRIRGRRG